MYSLAARYEIKELKEMAEEKFEHAVMTDWQGEAFALAARLAFGSTLASDEVLRRIGA